MVGLMVAQVVIGNKIDVEESKRMVGRVVRRERG